VQNGTYSADDKVNIGAEMQALGTAITGIYVNTKFNGIAVFGEQSGTSTLAEVTSGTAATIAYGENGGQSVTINAAVTSKLNALTTLTAAANTGEDAAAKAANAALVTVSSVEDAITEVNTTRAAYGALQNQLEHAANNMATTKENLQAAESRVRDVDLAEEMMEYTKNNILLQAAQAMLAQANVQPQGVLQLLQ
jgi:flagellin